jgi:hypothetical protein
LDPAGDERIRDLLDELGPDGTVTVARDSPPPGGQRTVLVEANDAEGRLRRVRILLWHLPPLPEVPPPQVAELPSGPSGPEREPADGDPGDGDPGDGDPSDEGDASDGGEASEGGESSQEGRGTAESGRVDTSGTDAGGSPEAGAEAGGQGDGPESEGGETEASESAAWPRAWLWALAALLLALALAPLLRRLRARERLPPAGVPVRLVPHPDPAGRVGVPAGPAIAVSFRIERGGPAHVSARPDSEPDRVPPEPRRAGE